MTKKRIISLATSMLCAASICGAQPLTVNAALYSSEMTSGNFLYKKVDVNYAKNFGEIINFVRSYIERSKLTIRGILKCDYIYRYRE